MIISRRERWLWRGRSGACIGVRCAGGRSWCGSCRLGIAMDERTAEMGRLRREGLTLAEIGQRFSMSISSVREITAPHVSREEVFAARVPARERAREEVRGMLRELEAQGLSRREIADAAGLHTATVHAYLGPSCRDVHSLARFAERLSSSQRQVDEATLIADIQACARDLGRTPGSNAFDNWLGFGGSQLALIRF